MRPFTAALDLRRYVGRWSLHSASHAGRFFCLILDLVRGILEWRIWLPRTFELTMAVGYGSLFIVLLVAGFAGACANGYAVARLFCCMMAMATILKGIGCKRPRRCRESSRTRATGVTNSGV